MVVKYLLCGLVLVSLTAGSRTLKIPVILKQHFVNITQFLGFCYFYEVRIH